MMMQGKRKASMRMTLVLGVVSVLCAIAPSVAAAKPELKLYPTVPDYAQAGQSIDIDVIVANEGDERTHGPLTVSDTVGAGLSIPEAFEGFGGFATTSILYPETPEEEGHPATCETSGSTVTCPVADSLPPGAQLKLVFISTVSSTASGALLNSVTVSGGETASVSSEHSINVASPGPFEFDRFGVSFRDAFSGLVGEPLEQAASDPRDFTTSLSISSFQGLNIFPIAFPIEHFRDVTAHLPAGLEGNPTSTELCTAAQLAEDPGGQEEEVPLCPIDSQVGVARVMLPTGLSLAGLYNMAPPPGYAAELGFKVLGTIVTLDAKLRPADNGIDIVSRNTSTTLPITSVDITAWGDPASPSHDRLRGGCLASGAFLPGANGRVCPTTAPDRAFLRLPTSCSGGGLPFGIEANSYEHTDRFVHDSSSGPSMIGCERVPFSPTIFTQPTATAANSPTGVAVQLALPQNSNPQGLAEGDLKKAVVTLPEGMALNPSSADGLQACDDAHLKLGSGEPADCPDASEVGTVTLHTPLLGNPVEGFVWLRTQNSSDPASGEMFRLAIELRDDLHGIDIKVPGQVAANPVTGRLTSTFDNAPQLPFSDMTLHFKAGARAPLTTPFSCIPQTTEADLYPWARPDTPVHKTMTFQLTSGPEGTPCTSTPGFNPGFSAGVASVQAGGFTPFLTTFSRKDADQSMQRVSVRLPLGVSGSLIGLPLCPEAQASVGACSQASEIGTVTAGAGAGPTPFYVTGGKVFMTGPYEGAPFGLSIVVPAKAGPFDLGNVNVRAKVEVDPHTAQLTVTSDPLPQIVGGVPVNLRLVNVTINRPGFTFNPTNCDPLSVTGTMTGGQGAVASVSNHFQVTNCGALAFKPSFKVSTPGKTSRQNGAGLDVKLTYPKGAFGKDANIARVKVSLPKQLPSRLTTLQKACLAATFEANPAACPAASRIGAAQAVTPIIPVPLTGPVYFVSHGGEAFPDLVIVLQGYGVTVDLVGTTFISKAGITSTTFRQVPDVPVGSFELKLPQGKFSALAANGNLCKDNLKMPTAFVAQDGAEVHQSTPISTTGCPKSKKAHRASPHPSKRSKKGQGK